MRNRKIATVLAFVGIVAPVTGIHKFYLGQPRWGIAYLLFAWTPIPHVASAIEGILYLLQDQDSFDQRFNTHEAFIPESQSQDNVAQDFDPHKVSAIADALRQLEQLRQEGLITELEFEQKRRILLDRMG